MSIRDYMPEEIVFCKVSEFINILTPQELIESIFIMIGIGEWLASTLIMNNKAGLVSDLLMDEKNQSI